MIFRFDCSDIDECDAYYPNQCSNDSVCVNSIGSYRCLCMVGLKGDGMLPSNNSNSANLPVPCQDVDECLLPDTKCSSPHVCVNSYGSFTCTCDAGYQLIGRSCFGKISQSHSSPTCSKVQKGFYYWSSLLAQKPSEYVHWCGGWNQMFFTDTWQNRVQTAKYQHHSKIALLAPNGNEVGEDIF